MEAEAERRGFYRVKPRPPFQDPALRIYVPCFGRLVDQARLSPAELAEAGFRPEWFCPPPARDTAR